MLKLVFPLRRLPTLSRAEFHKYWFESHGPLVRQHARVLGIRRYVQLHTLDEPLNAVLRESRGTHEPYDGVAELWWDSREAMERALASPDAQQAARELLEDERRFIDLPRSALWLGTERTIIEP